MSVERGKGWLPGRGTNPGSFLFAATPGQRHTDVSAKHWTANGWWGDQGATSQCVIYSGLHAMHDSPVPRPGPKPLVLPQTLYWEGQDLDGTSHADAHSGLSMDAGAQVFKRRGLIGSYRWAGDLDDVLDALMVGVILIGSPWMTGMDSPNFAGVVQFTGRSTGGHQFVANGFSKRTRLIRCKNSWGRGWAARGYFYLPFDAIPLIFRADGAACIVREIPVPPAPRPAR